MPKAICGERLAQPFEDCGPIYCICGRQSQDGQRKPTYQTADDSSQVEDAPEPSKICALLVFRGVRDHDGTLRRPQQTSADTQPDTSKDVEAEDVSMDGHQQADGIDAVSHTPESQDPFDADLVDEGAAKEAEDRKRTVQRCVLCGVHG